MADPTLAKMVAHLQRLFPGAAADSPNAHLLISALAEIDRRLTALEERTDDLPPPRVVWPRYGLDACPGSATAVQGSEGRASCPSCRRVFAPVPRPDGLTEIPEHER